MLKSVEKQHSYSKLLTDYNTIFSIFLLEKVKSNKCTYIPFIVKSRKQVSLHQKHEVCVSFFFPSPVLSESRSLVYTLAEKEYPLRNFGDLRNRSIVQNV